MTLRLTSSSLAGTLRKLVAVGTARLRSMLAAIAAAAPFSAVPGSSSTTGLAGAGLAGGAATLGVVVGAGAAAGSAAGAGVAATGEEPSRTSPEVVPRSLGGAVGGRDGAAPLPLANSSRHDSLTESGSSAYCSYISSTSQELAPKPLPSDVVVTPFRVVVGTTRDPGATRSRGSPRKFPAAADPVVYLLPSCR